MASHGNFATAGTEGERREPSPTEITSRSAPNGLGQSPDTTCYGCPGQGEGAPCHAAVKTRNEEQDIQPGSDGHKTKPPVPTKGVDRAPEFPFLSFPEKLWRMMESDQFQSIWWSKNGKCVAINEELFKEEVLGREAPLRVFVTQSMKTFLRQMNRYGFTKLQRDFQRSASLPELLAEEAAASAHSQILYYYNPGFNREHPHLLQTCKRRVNVKRRALEALEMGEQLHCTSPEVQPARDTQEPPPVMGIPAKQWAEAPPGFSSSLPSPPAALLRRSPPPGQSLRVPHCPTCTCSPSTADAGDAHSMAHRRESVGSQQPGESIADS